MWLHPSVLAVGTPQWGQLRTAPEEISPSSPSSGPLSADCSLYSAQLRFSCHAALHAKQLIVLQLVQTHCCTPASGLQKIPLLQSLPRHGRHTSVPSFAISACSSPHCSKAASSAAEQPDSSQSVCLTSTMQPNPGQTTCHMPFMHLVINTKRSPEMLRAPQSRAEGTGKRSLDRKRADTRRKQIVRRRCIHPSTPSPESHDEVARRRATGAD